MTNREGKRLEKMLYYVLGCRPDEFGLFPVDGFVKIKDLLKALNEIDGFKGLKAKQIKDFFAIFKPERLIFIEDQNLIGVKRDFANPEIFETSFVENPPSKLFTPVKPRGWIRASTEGIAAERIILTPKKDLAERLAKRRGALIIEVDTRKAMEEGAVFERFLERLYLSSWLPPSALKGPKVDEEFKKRYGPKPKKEEKEKTETKVILPPEPMAFRKLTKGRKKDPAWKRQRRKHKKF